MYSYSGCYNAQCLTDWTSEWGGGSLPKAKHGTAVITPGIGASPLGVEMRPGGAWDTFYQLQRTPAQNAAASVVYHISYQIPNASDLASCQALEFEIQRNDGQHLLNGGVQFDLKDTKKVRTYDFSAGHWVATPIPCDDSLLIGGAILDVVCVYDLLPQSITFRGLQINGQWNQLGITRPAVAKPQSAYLNYAFQFDFTANHNPAVLLIPEIDITVT
jgi:hypothetical protein